MKTRHKGIDIAYITMGEGRPLVLLHGYLEAKEVWDPLTEVLSNSFRVISVDLPGHGESGILSDIHTMEMMAEAVREVIIHEKCKKIIMAGHSMGGYVTLAFAEMFPELLAGYVLFHSHPHADSPETVAKRNREIAIVSAGRKNLMYPSNVSMMFAEKNMKHMAEALARSELIASRCPDEGIIAVLKGMMARPSRVQVIEEGRLPLLWILGRHDLYFAPETALGNVKLPHNTSVVILEETGHLGFIEETERSAEVIIQFAGAIKE
jgi:pimeloyl-ACP methyl ester carboxylesterase